MKKILIFTISFLVLTINANENYYYYVNLTKVDNDKLTVNLIPPTLTQTEAEFCFPAMVHF